LVLLSPLILVRLLSVAEFGRYREFLLYAGLLGTLVAFGINNSLLYFVPARPQDTWRFVRQSVVLTAFNSLVGVGLLAVLDVLFEGALVGDFLVPVSLYVLVLINVDFWEFLWLARKRPGAVLAYTAGRVLARITVVTAAAALARDVDTIVVSLIVLEAVRLVISFIAWRHAVRGPEAGADGSWREQLRFCAPVGASLALTTTNKSVTGIFISKVMGPVALAHYVIGAYLEPVIHILRNSISDALLPEMADKGRRAADPLQLWRRTTVLSTALLLPAAVLLHHFAEPIVVTFFSAAYLPAAAVLQIYVLVFVRECFDFGVLLRAMNRTAPIITGNLAAVLANFALLMLLAPRFGLVGAVAAFVASRFLDGLYLAWRTRRLLGVSVGEFASWADLGRVVVATAGAAVPLAFDWIQALGVAGFVPASLLFAATYAVALRVLRLPEAVRVFERLRQPLDARP
jgi:O-antigen/teichoic acid export membrane protein